MGERPLVSIVVPVYNVETYLDRCIESILSQTYGDFECLLIDDGSTDDSGRLADEWAARDPRVHTYHKTNGGLSDARNYGIARCTGEYLTFVDSDDWIYGDCLEVLVEDADRFSADIVVSPPTRFRCFEDSSSMRRNENRCREFTQSEYLEVFFRVNGNRTVHYAWGKLYRRELIDDSQYPVGMLNEDVEGFFKALLRARRIVETNRQLYCYFYNRAGITGRPFGENYLSLVEVWERIVDIARRERSDLADLAEYNLMRADFTVLCDMIVHGDAGTDEVYEDQRAELQARLRSSLPALMQGRMSAGRKAAAVVVAFLYRPIRWAARRVLR